MATKERQVVGSTNGAVGLLGQQVTVFGVLAESALQMTEVQKTLLGLASSCAADILESTVVTQTEIARMSFDAILHGDPVALMSLGRRAARTGFRNGMDCAARNLQTARSLGSHILDTLATPSWGNSGTA